MARQYDVRPQQRDNYFVRTYAGRDADKIEMSFNLSTYQPHLKVGVCVGGCEGEWAWGLVGGSVGGLVGGSVGQGRALAGGGRCACVHVCVCVCVCACVWVRVVRAVEIAILRLLPHEMHAPIHPQP